MNQGSFMKPILLCSGRLPTFCEWTTPVKMVRHYLDYIVNCRDRLTTHVNIQANINTFANRHLSGKDFSHNWQPPSYSSIQGHSEEECFRATFHCTEGMFITFATFITEVTFSPACLSDCQLEMPISCGFRWNLMDECTLTWRNCAGDSPQQDLFILTVTRYEIQTWSNHYFRSQFPFHLSEHKPHYHSHRSNSQHTTPDVGFLLWADEPANNC